MKEKFSGYYRQKDLSEVINSNKVVIALDSSVLCNLYGLHDEVWKPILSMLDNLEDLRLVSIKRDRLKFLFEREQAQAVRKAIPDASQMLNVVMSGDYVRMIAAATLMVANSASAYMSAVDAAELNYITSGWDLDDEESGIIHENVNLPTWERE